MSRTQPTKPEVPLSTFTLLFNEILHYNQHQTKTIDELEDRLHSMGLGIGKRYLELIALRNYSKNMKRETTAVACLQFVYSTIWKNLFGRTASGLVKGNDEDNELYLLESEPITNKFISTSFSNNSNGGDMGGMGDLNCAAFLAGIVNGAMIAMDVDCTVSAGWDEGHTQTVFVVKIAQPLPK